jgi:hypothetical protein
MGFDRIMALFELRLSRLLFYYQALREHAVLLTSLVCFCFSETYVQAVSIKNVCYGLIRDIIIIVVILLGKIL